MTTFVREPVPRYICKMFGPYDGFPLQRCPTGGALVLPQANQEDVAGRSHTGQVDGVPECALLTMFSSLQVTPLAYDIIVIGLSPLSLAELVVYTDVPTRHFICLGLTSYKASTSRHPGCQ